MSEPCEYCQETNASWLDRPTGLAFCGGAHREDWYGLASSPLLQSEETGVETEMDLYGATVGLRCRFGIALSDYDLYLLDPVPGLVSPLALRVPRLLVKYGFMPHYSFLHHFDFLVKIQKTASDLAEELTHISLELLGEPISFSGKALIEFLHFLQDPHVWSNFPLYMQVFLKAIQTRDASLVAMREHATLTSKLLYRHARFMLCHLLVYPESGKKFLDALDAVVEVHGIDLVPRSVQDYAQLKLGLISGARTQPRLSLPGEGVGEVRNVRLGLPPFSDITWPVTVENYKQDDRQGFVPYVAHLTDKSRVSIVAMDDQGKLAGYVTCHFERSDFDWLEEPEQKLEDPNLEVFVRRNLPDTVAQIFAIDGLHTVWRGGREESLASLLMYHALEMAVACAGDLGIDRVACHSVARTTAVIMRQFGATFLRESALPGWIDARRGEKKGIAEDIEYYMEQFPFEMEDDAEAFAPAQGKGADVAYKKLKEIWRDPHYKFDRQLKQMKDASRNIKRNNWDTFLVIDGENIRFHERMAKYRKLVAQEGVVKRERVEAEEGETESKKQRTGLFIYFPESSLGSFALATA